MDKLVNFINTMNTMLEALPECGSTEKIEMLSDNVVSDMLELFRELLPEKHYVLCKDTDEFVSLFDTDTERDNYIKSMTENGTTCKNINYADFIEYSNQSAGILDHYNTETGIAIFSL